MTFESEQSQADQNKQKQPDLPENHADAFKANLEAMINKSLIDPLNKDTQPVTASIEGFKKNINLFKDAVTNVDLTDTLHMKVSTSMPGLIGENASVSDYKGLNFRDDALVFDVGLAQGCKLPRGKKQDMVALQVSAALDEDISGISKISAFILANNAIDGTRPNQVALGGAFTQTF